MLNALQQQSNDVTQKYGHLFDKSAANLINQQ